MLYFALIGDLIESKKITERHQVQELVKTCLVAINDKYKTFVVSDFSLTLGDEFQGLLTLEAPIFKIIDEISVNLSPYEVRFGIGLGDILTHIDPKQSIGADGPAYWYARAAIEHVHDRNDYGNTKLSVATADRAQTNAVNALISSTEFIKSNWRSSQRIVFDTLLNHDIYREQFEQGPIARHLDLNVSAFSKRLKSSGIKLYFRSRQVALDLLREPSVDREEAKNA